MFPALNIIDVARVNLSARTQEEIEVQAKVCYAAICGTRKVVGDQTPDGSVCNMHRIMATLTVSDKSGRVEIAWTEYGDSLFV